MSKTEEFEPLFGTNKGIVWAADVEPKEFKSIMEEIGDTAGLAGVKIGFELGLGLSLPEAVRIVRANSGVKVQYDHQKAANDIPDTGKNFARTMVNADIDSAIIFPFTGPNTQDSWTRALTENNINVFTGAEMTHKGFSEQENGRITTRGMDEIITQALELGISHFIVPGNRPSSVRKWKDKIEAARGEGRYALAAPGFVSQGGDVSEATQAAGEYWNPIIGRGIHANQDGRSPREAIEYYALKMKESE